MLRADLRACIDEVAAWVPVAWRAAVQWTKTLIDLPAIEHLLAHRVAWSWMLEDEQLKSLAATEPEVRVMVLAQGEYAPLVRPAKAKSLSERWLIEWRTRLPRAPRRQLQRLERLVALVETQLRSNVSDPAAGVPQGREARRGLEQLLVGHFRRAFLEPAAVFVYLLLVALELERLRGELVSRRLFVREAQ